MNNKFKNYIIGVIALHLISCSSSKPSDHGKIGASSQAQVGSSDISNGIYKEKIKYSFELKGTNDVGPNLLDFDLNTKTELNLASSSAAEAFSITIEGCSSGFTTTASETTAFVELYKQDVGCLAKLNSFTINGVVYTPRSSGDCGIASDCQFTTFANNQIAIFENSAGVPATDYLNVSVISQLPSPLTTPSNISYRFYRLSKRSTTVLANSNMYDSANGHAISISGITAPSFNMDSLVFNGINQDVGADGEGKFTFKLECPQNLTGDSDIANDATSIMCKDVNFADIEYKLVEDTWGVISSNHSLTYAEAQGIFPGVGLTLDTSPSSNVLEHGSSLTTNDYGGISLLNLVGPSEMHLHPNMILILGVNISGVGYLSFEYFPISISTLSETQ